MSARELLAAFIRDVMGDTAYHRISLATVQAPSTGDSVDLKPDNPAISGDGLQGVPIVYGAPGLKAKFAPGVKMLLFFIDGDPRQPYAMCFSGSATEVSIGDGVMGIARVGDTVVITSATSPSGPVTGSGVIVGGSVVGKA